MPSDPSLPAPESYKKIFVVGCPRSGTTWLQHMLQQHEDIVQVANESHLYRLVYSPFTYAHNIGLQARLARGGSFLRQYGVGAMLRGVTAEDIWQSILRNYKIYQANGAVGLHRLVSFSELEALLNEAKQAPGTDIDRAKLLIRQLLDRFFQNAGGQSHQVLVEKTPMHIDHVDVILASFPEAKVVEIVRDGRDVCASWQARGTTQKWAKQSTIKVIKQWERCIQRGQRFRADARWCDRIQTVKYEDLRHDPANGLMQLFDFAGLSSSPALIDNIIQANDIRNAKRRGQGQHVHKGQVGNWRSALSTADIQLWQDEAGSLLTQLGYN